MRRLKYYLICIMVLPTVIIMAGEALGGHIAGSVMSRDGAPVAEGVVLFFSDALGPAPDVNKFMRTPESIAHTDRHGNFKMELSEGKYYVGAMKSLSGKWGGPPREGDMFFISRDADNSPKLYEVHKDRPLDIGSMMEPEPVEVRSAEGITAVEGVVYGMNGNPLEDVVVFAYTGSVLDQGLAFVSGYTLSDGAYVLRIAEGGKYNLNVMGAFGSVFPGTGMTITDDGSEVSESISVDTGAVNSNVDIVIKNK